MDATVRAAVPRVRAVRAKRPELPREAHAGGAPKPLAGGGARVRRRGVGRAVALAGLLCVGCGAPGGGLPGASAPVVAVRAAGVSPPARPARVTLPDARRNAVLPGWRIVGNVSLLPLGSQAAALWRLPGDGAYLFHPARRPAKVYRFSVRSDGLVDFYFGCNAQGAGTMFRLDTRGGGNWSGFARTASWTHWQAPTRGFVAPRSTWVSVRLTLSGSAVTAAARWSGGGSTLVLHGFHAAGGGYGFQGDALGGGSVSLVRGFHAG